MRYQGIIFDLDGVICHTDKFHYLAWKKIADKLDIFFDETMNNLLRGVSRNESLDIILRNYQKPLTQDEKFALTEEKNNFYCDLLKQMTPEDLDPIVKTTLLQLREQNIKLAIGSSSKNAVFILNQLGITGLFDGICDGTMISKSKPEPEVFLKAAALIGLNPKDCLVVEDAVAGVLAAIAGGFSCAGIGEASKDPRVTYQIGEFNDLLNIVKDENR